MSDDFGGNQDLNAMARRLRSIVKISGGNQKVADLSDVPLSTLNTILAGKTDPRISTLQKLAPALGMSVGDLAFEISRSENTEYRTPESVRIPLRDVYASAGPGSEAVDEAPSRFLSFDPFFAAEWGVPLERVEALTARGDSMQPTIQDGAIVLIDRGDRELREKVIFAFRTPDGVRFKRFQRMVDGGAMLVSDNHEFYAPERVAPVDLEQFRIAGRAFWTGRMI